MGEVKPSSPAAGRPLSAPCPYNPLAHDVSRFECGKPSLDDWLRHKAARSERKSARCYVVCDRTIVAGYYCISTGSIAHTDVNAKLRKNMPDPIPVMILGRLAVDSRYQRRGIGPALLKDGLLRMVQASQTIGARAVLVHALDQETVGFYARHGFRQSPTHPLTLWLAMEEIIASL